MLFFEVQPMLLHILFSDCEHMMSSDIYSETSKTRQCSWGEFSIALCVCMSLLFSSSSLEKFKESYYKHS